MSEIRLENLRKSFDSHQVIGGIDLSVAEGEYCVFLGPSGCGKSTLLRLIAGLEQADSGAIHIGGRDVTRLAPKRRHVSMVFQSYALYPHMTVYENMAFGLRLARRTRGEVERRVRRTAESLHIAELLQRKPAQLSGGQRQRVAIGRAIVREPAVFLLDEPLSNLDTELRVRMRFELSRLHRRLGTTTIHVTHDQGEAMTLADRLVVIENGQVAQSGPPLELYHRPRQLFVAGFLGSPRMNLLPGRVQRVEDSQVIVVLADGTSIRLPTGPAGIREATEVTLGIRPEHLLPGPDQPNRIRGTVALVEHLGDHTLAYLEWQEETPPLVLRLGTERLPSVGETLSVELPGGHCHLFDRDGAALFVRES